MKDDGPFSFCPEHVLYLSQCFGLSVCFIVKDVAMLPRDAISNIFSFLFSRMLGSRCRTCSWILQA